MNLSDPAILIGVVIGCLVVVVVAGLYWAERSKSPTINPKRKSTEYWP